MKIIRKFGTAAISESLIGRCLRGGGVLTIGNFAENLARFIRNIVLARLLAPEAFSLMATVISSVAALEAFVEVGLGQSLTQKKKGAEEGFLNLTWWFSAVSGQLFISVLTSPRRLSASFVKGRK